MSASFTNIVAVGNATRDPESRSVGNGQVVNFILAVNRKVKGEKETTYLDVSIWGKTGEIALEYVKKGSSVLVSGSLEVRKYTAKDGSEKTVVGINAKELQLLGGGNRSENAPRTHLDALMNAPDTNDEIPF
jgi:single-strand DNA-binding protein